MKYELPKELNGNLSFLTIRKLKNPEKYGGFSKPVFITFRIIATLPGIAFIGFLIGIITLIISAINKSKILRIQATDLVLSSIFMGLVFPIIIFIIIKVVTSI